jgi:hypothetical protein
MQTRPSPQAPMPSMPTRDREIASTAKRLRRPKRRHQNAPPNHRISIHSDVPRTNANWTQSPSAGLAHSHHKSRHRREKSKKKEGETNQWGEAGATGRHAAVAAPPRNHTHRRCTEKEDEEDTGGREPPPQQRSRGRTNPQSKQTPNRPRTPTRVEKTTPVEKTPDTAPQRHTGTRRKNADRHARPSKWDRRQWPADRSEEPGILGA